MEDDLTETLILRNRSLIKTADVAKASSEDARARSGIVKRDAQLIRRRIQGGRTWLQFGRTSPSDAPSTLKRPGGPSAVVDLQHPFPLSPVHHLGLLTSERPVARG
jgi:hypothetical protein